MGLKIKETGLSLRPYEKCLLNGPESLNDEELLAVIIRCGTKEEDSVALSKRVLSSCGSKQGLLNVVDMTLKDLMKIKGIGKVKAIQIKCIAELSRRISKCCYSKGLSFRTAESVAMYYMEDLRHLKKECLMALFLDSACQYIKDVKVSVGTVNASLASPREVLIEALRYEAVNIILVHNHPSGNPMPSADDIAMTKAVYEAGEMIGIHLIDHIIIGDNKYISLREQEMIS